MVYQALRQTDAFKVLGPSDLFKLQDRYRADRLVPEKQKSGSDESGSFPSLEVSLNGLRRI